MRTVAGPSPTSSGSARPRQRRAIWASIAAAIAAAVLVQLLLAPFSGVDTLPPECYAYFGYVVPCGSGLWIGVALAVAAVVGAAVYAVARRK